MTELDHHALPDVLIGERYRVSGVVDRGGMGTVYRARDLRLDRDVAVKVVHDTDSGLARRLSREAQVLARLEHPNIVRVYDVGDLDGRPYIVTEYVDGLSLHALVSRGPLPPAQVAVIATGIARALDATHRAGIVHRDLKPANILLSATGVPRLLDYGIAEAGADSRLTLDGQVVGTPRYLSPEQATGSPLGPPTDVYSLGLVLLECLTGEAPFPGSVAESLAARVAVAPAVSLDLDPIWVGLLQAMTARAPAERPSAAAVAVALTSPPMARTGAEPTEEVPTAANTLVQPGDGWSGVPTDQRATLERGRTFRRRRWLAVAALTVAVPLSAATWALASAGDAGEGTNSPPTTGAPTTTAVTPSPTAPSVTPTTRAPTTTRVPPGRKGRPPKDGHGGG